jgi:nucleoside-diphosphate-sugar epimerase
MTRHVVFGTGQVGRIVVEQLVAHGIDTVAVNRSGEGQIRGAEIVGGDATDPEFTSKVAAGADAVYFCLNAMNYDSWAQEFPPLQQAVLAGAESAGARMVVLDNMYAYGPVNGATLRETLPAKPESIKAQTRAAMTDELLAAHAQGRVEVAIGRASDYFGPGTQRSALGSSVFGKALTGGTAQVMGDTKQLHSYSYTPDVAAGLIMLATQPQAAGGIWHLPVAPAHTTESVLEQIYRYAGKKPRSFAAGAATLRLVGLFQPPMREYLHTLYQFQQRWVVDDSKFRAAFGDLATPLSSALSTTLDWYRKDAS